MQWKVLNAHVCILPLPALSDSLAVLLYSYIFNTSTVNSPHSIYKHTEAEPAQNSSHGEIQRRESGPVIILILLSWFFDIS